MHLRIQKTSFILALMFVATAVVIPLCPAQEKSERTEVTCTIDLKLPGVMSDIVSNALVRGFKKDESKVREYLKTAKKKYKSGHELAIAAAREFDIKEKTLFAAIEDYKHCNCKHEGGGAVGKKRVSLENSNGEVSEFAENVLVHVVLHEIGHGLVREFDLPILGNEETLADAFATHYIANYLPERAMEILEARVSSLMIEAREEPRTQWTVKGEHNSDARRAYQIVAIALAHDSSKFESLASLVEMNQSDFRKAVDYGSEVHRSWRRILRPLWMPNGRKSSEAKTIIEKQSVFADAISSGKLHREIDDALKSFDWHSQVKVVFASGAGGAGWSRSQRTVAVQDEYIHRFNSQGILKTTNQDKK